MKKCVRDHVKIFEKLGIEVIDVCTTGGSHMKYTVEFHGHRRYFIAPSSSSDVQGIINKTAEIKRWQRSILS